MSQYNIFTDGSKTTQGTGAGYVIMKGKSQLLLTNSINLRKNASIFRAEATAIQAAAESLTEIINPKIKFIRIFSDSQAVLKALDKDTIKSQTILNTRLALNTLSLQVHTLSLVWIKAHHGFEGNELAD